MECGDIAEVGTAARLVSAATATGLPLRGVLHAAAVFENAMLANMTDELISRNWAPKVHGAWNLHQATATLPAGLVLFVLLGSGSGGLARARCVRRGQQLAGRIRAVAPDSGPTRHWDRMGVVGRGRSCRRSSEPRPAKKWRPDSDGEGTAIAHWRDTAFTADEGAYAFQAQRRVLLRLMHKAGTIAASILVENQLSQVQGSIEQLTGQLRYVHDRADFSTITVSMMAAGAVAPAPQHASSLWQALTRSLDAAQWVVTAVIIGAGFVIPIALLLGLAAILARRFWPGQVAKSHAQE